MSAANATRLDGGGNGTLDARNMAWWVIGLRWTQGIMATTGLVGNSLVVATLTRRRYQSRFATAVFLHQTVMDLVVCVFTLVIILKPDQNPTDNRSLGFVLCHVVSSQLFYWYSVFASVQNLLLIAADRYCAVFRPVRYKTLSWRSAASWLVGLHFYSLLVNIIDVFSVEYSWESNSCGSEISSQVWKRVFKVYGFVWFGLVYLIPVLGVVCLYALIICRLSGRGRRTSRFRQRAATELTKSAVVITGIFIVCFSYDCVYYLLGHLDLVQYVYNSPTQLIGVFLVTLNSCANPVVYCIVMRSFRIRMVAAVCCCCSRVLAAASPDIGTGNANIGRHCRKGRGGGDGGGHDCRANRRLNNDVDDEDDDDDDCRDGDGGGANDIGSCCGVVADGAADDSCSATTSEAQKSSAAGTAVSSTLLTPPSPARWSSPPTPPPARSTGRLQFLFQFGGSRAHLLAAEPPLLMKELRGRAQSPGT